VRHVIINYRLLKHLFPSSHYKCLKSFLSLEVAIRVFQKCQKAKLSQNAGFTLIETIIAGLILCVVIAAVLSQSNFFITNVFNQSYGTNVTQELTDLLTGPSGIQSSFYYRVNFPPEVSPLISANLTINGSNVPPPNQIPNGCSSIHPTGVLPFIPSNNFPFPGVTAPVCPSKNADNTPCSGLTILQRNSTSVDEIQYTPVCRSIPSSTGVSTIAYESSPSLNPLGITCSDSQQAALVINYYNDITVSNSDGSPPASSSSPSQTVVYPGPNSQALAYAVCFKFLVSCNDPCDISILVEGAALYRNQNSLNVARATTTLHYLDGVGNTEVFAPPPSH
jgi:type II secretory pathway pseudopilin PulG